MGKARKMSLALVAASAAMTAGLATSASASGPNLISNGGFESPSVSDPFQTIAAGSDLGGWTVGGDSVDLIGTYWQAAEGSQSLDLSGNQPGSISQTFSTIPGATYHISFAESANPDATPSRQAGAVVTWNDAAVTGSPFSFDSANAASWAMNWQYQSADVTATGSSTTLTFASNTGDAYGPALDDISVTKTSVASTVKVTPPSQGSFTNNKSTAVFHALVTSSNPACAIGRVVNFTVTGAPAAVPVAGTSAVTDASGLASIKYVVGAGTYSVTASVDSLSPNCDPGSDSNSYNLAPPKKK